MDGCVAGDTSAAVEVRSKTEINRAWERNNRLHFPERPNPPGAASAKYRKRKGQALRSDDGRCSYDARLPHLPLIFCGVKGLTRRCLLKHQNGVG